MFPSKSKSKNKTLIKTQFAKRTPIGLFLLGALTLILSGCSFNGESNLVIGTALEYPPFEYTNEKGELEGIDIDLMRAFGKATNRSVTFVPMDFNQLNDALVTEKIDIIISAMTITENRMKILDFSDPYFKTYPVLLIRKDSPIKSGADLNKESIRLGVTEGSTGESLAQTLYANAEIISDPQENVILEKLISGQVDVMITDLIPAVQHYKVNKATIRINPSPLSDNFEYWGIGIKQGQVELKQELNDFLIDYRNSGELKTLIEFYLKDLQDELKEFDIPIYY